MSNFWMIHVAGLCFMLSACNPSDPAPAEKAPQVIAEVTTDASQAAYHAGKELYMTHCFFCHGKLADGQGPLAASMEGAKPRDMRDPALAKAHSDSLKRVILEGGLAVGLSENMPAWNSVLTSDDADVLVAFIQTVSKNGGILVEEQPLNLTDIPPASQPTY